MGYTLGIDLGTTFTAAAIYRDGRAEVVPLGNHSSTIPSLVFLREDETVLIGDAADRRGQQEPARLAREFKRRFGDSTPILLDRTPFSAERLMALMLRQILSDIATRQGSQPDVVSLAHPANWGQFKIDLLRQAVQMSGSAEAVFVTEPVGAAIQYASSERVEIGDVVTVYDLGGGTFDVAVLRKTATGFETMGQPQGIERLGGIDFDEAVFGHVRRSIGDAIDRLDTNDPATRSALARLRQEVVSAKESLSSDSDATIPVLLPNVQTQVRLTRSEFEDMIRPTLRATIETTRRAINNAGVPQNTIKAILLAGGSSRIPLIAELVRTEFGLPVVTDLHPKNSVALGAARFAAEGATATAAPAPLRAPSLVAPPPPPRPATPSTPTAAPAAPTQQDPVQPPSPPAPPGPSTPASSPPGPRVPMPIAAMAGAGGPGVPSGHDGPRAGSGGSNGKGDGNGSNGNGAGKAGGGSVWKKPWVIVLAVLVVVGAGVGTVLAVTGGSDGSSASPGSDAGVDTTQYVDTTPPETEYVDPTATTEYVDPSATTEYVDPGTTTETTPPTDAPPPDFTCDGDLCNRIDAVGFDDYTLSVYYETTGFEPDLNGEYHMHFYFNTVDTSQAGMPGSGPWQVWDLASAGGEYVFNFFNVDNFETFNAYGATAICVAVANADHTIHESTAQCYDLGTTIEPPAG